MFLLIQSNIIVWPSVYSLDIPLSSFSALQLLHVGTGSCVI